MGLVRYGSIFIGRLKANIVASLTHPTIDKYSNIITVIELGVGALRLDFYWSIKSKYCNEPNTPYHFRHRSPLYALILFQNRISHPTNIAHLGQVVNSDNIGTICDRGTTSCCGSPDSLFRVGLV